MFDRRSFIALLLNWKISRATCQFVIVSWHSANSLSNEEWQCLPELKSNQVNWFLPRCMQCRRGIAMRILSVCLSVRPSVTRVYCDKTQERSVQIFTPYKRTFSLVFW